MLAPEIFLLVAQQIGKHAAVFHVVPINHPVVAVFRAAGPDERRAADGAGLVKISAQIIFRLCGRIHHRVVDVCAVDFQPAVKIGVALV